ncbi:MAG: diaminopimelate decarboxylase [Gemmatimonadaceae bacterium]|jgi:diaminopimelate decarboxylase|nr:diaminopimelate decarboxylase [Gemmatimonadaceae bacterium]
MGQGVLTEGFWRQSGALWCEDVPLAAIADAVGTPTYVYSSAAIRGAYARLAQALQPLPVRIHYAVKANSNLAVLRVLQEAGAGADIVSAGELHRARLAGFRGEDIVFAGVGKTRTDIEHALDAGVLFINVESEQELALVGEVAAARGDVARVALRINPNVDDATAGHAYITTGEAGSKFGIDVARARDAARQAMALPGVALVGLDMHIGSQIGELAAFEGAQRRLRTLLDEVRADGCDTVRWVDVGGGFPVAYADGEPHADLEGYARVLGALFGDAGVQLIVEPGRYLVAQAGVLLTTVLYRKTSGRKAFMVADAGMNDLLRPSHYEAHHAIEPVLAVTQPSTTVDVVGPVCESGDFLAVDRTMPDVPPGTLLAVRDAGAYGFAMSSNYNSRPRAAEVLVQGSQWGVATVRESLDDLVRLERVAPDWRSA